MSKKLNSYYYHCSNCNSLLDANSLDFIDHTGQMQLRTNFNCQTCQETFFSVENVMQDNPQRKFYCIFCHIAATYLFIEHDWIDYWRCFNCKSSFEENLFPEYNSIQTINIYTTFNSNLYVLRQYLDKKCSQIELLPPNPEDTVIIIKQFDFLFPDINPSNIANKIKNYLPFL